MATNPVPPTKTGIWQIDIDNFKAFGEAERLILEGKNALIFGTNGSGKSSLVAALRYFLQTNGSNQAQINALFGGEENLRNIHQSPDKTSSVALTMQEASGAKKSYLFSSDNSTHKSSEIEAMRASSDFLNYNLLAQFYQFRAHQQSNLFPIFEQDFFAEWYHAAWKMSFEQKLQELREKSAEIKNIKFAQGKIPSKKSPEIKTFQAEIVKFNEALDKQIQDLITPANEFLKLLLRDKIEILLRYTQPLSLLDGGDNYYEFGQAVVELQLRIDGKPVARPHAFLNEARLTALALSIKLASISQSLQASDWKLLVLDDLLISMDMSNRMRVFEHFLFDARYKGHQKIILTHDRSLYDILEKNIRLHQSKGNDWAFLELYEGAGLGKSPIVRTGKSYIERASAALEDKELDFCALLLRKEVEYQLQVFCSEDMASLARYENLRPMAKAASETGLIDLFWEEERERVQKLWKNELNAAEIAAISISVDASKLSADEETKNKQLALCKELAALIEKWLQERAKHKTSLEKNKKDLESLGKKLDELRARILNAGAHAMPSQPFFEWELQGAIEIVKKFGASVQRIKNI